MNVSKFIAALIVKNHNNGSFNREDANLRDKIYFRVSKAIDLAKDFRLNITVLEDRFIINDFFEEIDFKPIVIYKKNVYDSNLADFFFGLKRTNNVNSYLSYFRHCHEDKYLQVIEHSNSVEVSIVNRSKAVTHGNCYCYAI